MVDPLWLFFIALIVVGVWAWLDYQKGGKYE